MNAVLDFQVGRVSPIPDPYRVAKCRWPRPDRNTPPPPPTFTLVRVGKTGFPVPCHSLAIHLPSSVAVRDLWIEAQRVKRKKPKWTLCHCFQVARAYMDMKNDPLKAKERKS